MLTPILAHAGRPASAHDLWAGWAPDPLLVLLLLGALWVHHRGRTPSRRPDHRRRARTYVAGIVVLAVALVSPLEALAHDLLAAHMVQHVLMVLVAAPLLAFSAPGPALLRGMPGAARRLSSDVRARARRRPLVLRLPSHPVTVLLLYLVSLWGWHASLAYGAALDHDGWHGLEHVMFVGTALLLWRVLLSGRRGQRVPGGLALLVTFGAAMGSVLLSALMTFSTEPWYDAYLATTPAWGIDPLDDQHLAGALMWVPAGAIHVLIALRLFASWLHESGDPVSSSPTG